MTDTEASVKRALTMVGGTYVYAAEDPTNREFDCSGLVHWAYHPDFPTLTRVTYSMKEQGDAVSLANGGSARQRGDLLFPDAGHVAICLGGGQICEAATEGIPIHVRDDYIKNPVAIRRLGPNSGNPGSGVSGTTDSGASGSGSTDAGSGSSNPFEMLWDQLQGIKGTFTELNTFIGVVENPKFWIRVLQIVCGSILVGIGLTWLSISAAKSEYFPSTPTTDFVGRQLGKHTKKAGNIMKESFNNAVTGKGA